MSLKGTKTKENLEAAFAGESQANRRYLYFAQKADIEGYNDVATVFRSTAEGETGHAHGHLEYLEEVERWFSFYNLCLVWKQILHLPYKNPQVHDDRLYS